MVPAEHKIVVLLYGQGLYHTVIWNVKQLCHYYTFWCS